MKHAHVEATLTRTELAAPFAIPELPFEPVERPSRTVVEWDGGEWMEWDPATGEIIATGTTGGEG